MKRSWLGRSLRRQFLLGILTLVPLGATILILVWIFSYIDDILQPVIRLIWGRAVPGIGFAITIVLVYLAGVIADNVVGKRLIRYGDLLVAKVPIVRPLYISIKQILESLSAPNKSGMLQTVLLEFPREGVWSIGFITKESPSQDGETRLNVFVPTAPNPMSGFLLIVREDQVIRTDIPVDEGFKMVVSAGKVSPQGLSDKLAGRTG